MDTRLSSENVQHELLADLRRILQQTDPSPDQFLVRRDLMKMLTIGNILGMAFELAWQG
jgi:hypothetical protein